MAINKRSASGGVVHLRQDRPHTAAGTEEEWVAGALPAIQQVVGWVEQFQQVALQSSLPWGDEAARVMLDLSQAKSPVQLFSVASRAASRQMDVLARQQAALMQQMVDSQISLFGWLVRKEDPLKTEPPDATNGGGLLDVWANAQDEWVKYAQTVLAPGAAAQSSR